MPKKPSLRNRLAGEPSPYLAQHAGNPVAWQPWGEEAFAAARSCDVPIFLSIGYSTCHWCHVMAHESFEDDEVARLLNENFVCIKVDREERPDIDGVYMHVCQAMTGSGGWPLTIIMTPDKQPFFAATYLPPRSQGGRTGLRELLSRVADIWRDRRDDILTGAQGIIEQLGRRPAAAEAAPEAAQAAEMAFKGLTDTFDTENAGFGHAPKFPSPHTLLFLLRYWRRTGSSDALRMTAETLRAMRHGGIYDHVGFGFHRYSTDPFWLQPHFEKMLYDQAMLMWAYSEAFQATGTDEFSRTAREIAAFVLRDLRSPEGAFYCALDADSEEGEGAFYQWNFEELQAVLDHDEMQIAEKLCGVARHGNARDEATGAPTGRTILHLACSPADYARRHGIPLQDLEARFERLRCKLFTLRSQRTPPLRDEKILTDWNALMVGALAIAGRTLDEPRFITASEKAAGFVLSRLYDTQRGLLHCRGTGLSGIQANIDDYSFMIWGLLELYRAGFDERCLLKAIALQDELDERYSDKDTGAYFTAPALSDDLPLRPLALHDGALPSGNSLSVLNLLRLADITGRAQYQQRARRVKDAFSRHIQHAPDALCMLMCACEYEIGPPATITVAGTPGAADTRELLSAVNSLYLPDACVVLHPDSRDCGELARHMPGGALKHTAGGRAAAYVCSAGTCREPATDAAVLRGLLSA